MNNSNRLLLRRHRILSLVAALLSTHACAAPPVESPASSCLDDRSGLSVTLGSAGPDDKRVEVGLVHCQSTEEFVLVARKGRKEVSTNVVLRLPTSIEPVAKSLDVVKIAGHEIAILSLRSLDVVETDTGPIQRLVVVNQTQEGATLDLLSWDKAIVVREPTRARITVWRNDIDIERALNVLVPHAFVFDESGAREVPLNRDELAMFTKRVDLALSRVSAASCIADLYSATACARGPELLALSKLLKSIRVLH